MSDVPPTDGEGARGAAPPPYPGGAAPYPGGAGQPVTPPPYPGGSGYPPPGGYPGGPVAAAPTWAYATFGARLGGWLIDWLILGLVNTVITRVLVSVAFLRVDYTTHTVSRGVTTSHLHHISVLAQVVYVVLILLYGAFLCGSARGQTLGMMVVRARAVDGDTGAPIGFGRALGRAAFELLLFFLLIVPWMVDMLFPAWDGRRQTLHDKVSRSVVLKVPPGFPG